MTFKATLEVCALTLALCASSGAWAGCKSPSTPVDPTAQPLGVERPAPAPAYSCDGSDWRAAMRCDDETCAVEAVGAQCAECVDAAVRCVDGRSSGCDEKLAACIGPERGRFVENARQAVRHLDGTLRAAPLGPPGTHSTFRISHYDVDRLLGVSEDGETVVAYDRDDVGGLARAESRIRVLTGDGDLLWARPLDEYGECALPVVSRRKALIASRCGDRVRVAEAETGFVRHELEISGPRHIPAPRFSEDRWLSIFSEGQWEVHDLKTDQIVAVLPGRRAPVVSPSGRFVAFENGGLRVGTLEAPRTALVQTDEELEKVAWGQDDTLFVHSRYGRLSRFSLPNGIDVGDIALEGVGSAWQLEETPIDVVAGRSEKMSLENLREGLTVDPLDGRTSRQFVPLPNPFVFVSFGHSFGYERPVSGFEVLDDGRVFTGSTLFGVTEFDAEGAIRPTGLLRGSPRVVAPGPNPSELVLAAEGGARIFDLNDGTSRPLPIPYRFHHFLIRPYSGGFVAVGPGDTADARLIEPRTLAVFDERGEPVTKPLQLGWIWDAAIVDDTLHVVSSSDFVTFAIEDDRLRELKRTPSDGGALATERGLAVLWRDDGEASFVELDGHAVRQTFDVKPRGNQFINRPCAVADGGAFAACLRPRDDGKGGKSWIVTFDLALQTEVARHPVTAAGLRMGVHAVSADGRFVMIGSPDGPAVFDRQREAFLDLPIRTNLATFRGDDLVLVHDTFLHVVDPQNAALR